MIVIALNKNTLRWFVGGLLVVLGVLSLLGINLLGGTVFAVTGIGAGVLILTKYL